jgi:tyrosyl-tRNA synthetase
MTIDEQVALLMQGTEYGDAPTAAAMTRELRARLEDSQKTGRPLKIYCGYDPRTSDLHWATPSPCASSASFRSSGMR